jgi:predicted transcriptional regulator
LSVIGELESQVLEVLRKKGTATASDVLQVLRERRGLAYTTVSTTLDRLHKKGLVGRKTLSGPGGKKYLFSPSGDERLKRRIVESSLKRLTSAFGDTANSVIYRYLQSLPPSKYNGLKKQVQKTRPGKLRKSLL